MQTHVKGRKLAENTELTRKKIKKCLNKPMIKKKRKSMPTGEIEPGYKKTFVCAGSDCGETN